MKITSLKQTGTLFFITAAAVLSLAGCGKDAGQELSVQEPSGQQSGVENSDGNPQEEYLGLKQAGIIQEDENYWYICGIYRIVKIDKNTKEEEILWERAKSAKAERAYVYSVGNGLLLGDKIYFIEKYALDSREKFLSVISTDGTGYEPLVKFSNHLEKDKMILKDNAIYIDTGDGLASYPLNKKGESEIFANKDAKDAKDIYDVIGCKKYIYFNDNYYLTEDYTEGHKLYLIDRQSMEKSELADVSSDRKITSALAPNWGKTVIVIGMDEEYVYLERYAGDGLYQYTKISLETGEESLIFERKKEWDAVYSAWYLMDMTVKDGYLYYAGDKDYKLYVMRRSLENPAEEEILGDAFYDTGIGEVGGMISHYEAVYSKADPDCVIFSSLTDRIVVDERFAGAAKINQTLKEWQEGILEEEKKMAEEALAEETGFAIGWSYDSRLSEAEEIYFDQRYLSFRQEESYYWGGAHDMVYFRGFTFDLETGSMLKLGDVIGNSEEELKEIAVTYFGKMIDAEPDNFWPDAKDVVRDSIDLDYDFYLTKEGIHFDFEAYELACYAAGIQEVVIPYEEFELKIPIGEDAAHTTLEKEGSADLTKEPEIVLASEDWGLSFGESGTQPRGNAKVEDLAYYNAYFMGDDSEKVLYLTFDCGYENGNTEPILDALKKHNAPGTFFVVGHFLETEPELVKRMVEEGHAVGNHTYHHLDMASISEKEDFQKELTDVADLFQEITGTELSLYYRPPQGKCNVNNLRMAKELGYATIFWSLAHVDWDQNKQPSHKEAIDKLTSRVHPGAVVLLHNTSKTNGEILDELLTKWEEMGYTFRPLSDLTGQ